MGYCRKVFHGSRGNCSRHGGDGRCNDPLCGATALGRIQGRVLRTLEAGLAALSSLNLPGDHIMMAMFRNFFLTFSRIFAATATVAEAAEIGATIVKTATEVYAEERNIQLAEARAKLLKVNKGIAKL